MKHFVDRLIHIIVLVKKQYNTHMRLIEQFGAMLMYGMRYVAYHYGNPIIAYVVSKSIGKLSKVKTKDNV